MRKRIGRFDIAREGDAFTFTARDDGYHALARNLRVGSLALVALAPAFLALLAPDEPAVPVAALMVLGMFAPAIDMIYTARFRVFRAGPWSTVAQKISIQPAGEGDARHAPGGLRVIVDGAAIEGVESPRLRVWTSVVVMQNQGATNTTLRHHVELVLRRRVIRVDTLEDQDDALDLGRALIEALGLPETAVEADAGPAFEGTGAGLAIGVVGALVSIPVAIGAVIWAMNVDLGDSSAPRFAVAGLAAALFALLVEEVAFRFALAALTRKTAQAYDIDVDAGPFARAAQRGTAAVGAAALALVLLGMHTGVADLPRSDFSLGGAHFALAEMDGVATPIGLAQGRLVAVDPRTGAARWTRPVPQTITRLDLRAAPALAHGTDYFPRSASLLAFDPRSGAIGWQQQASGDWSSLFRHGGCVVLASSGKYRGFDERDGQPCAALAELDASSNPADDARRMMQAAADRPEKDPLQAKRDALQAAERAQLEAERTGDRVTRKVGGIEYDLDARAGQLVVRAFGPSGKLWERELPAARLHDHPFAVGEGLVLVAGVRLGGQKSPGRLRLVGLDAATGAVRFVSHHPARDGWQADVAVSGGVGLVAWAGELWGVDPKSGAVRWRFSSR
jgi:hypothetical protein